MAVNKRDRRWMLSVWYSVWSCLLSVLFGEVCEESFQWGGGRRLIRNINQVRAEWMGLITKLGNVFSLNTPLHLPIRPASLSQPRRLAPSALRKTVQNESFSRKSESLYAPKNIQTNFLLRSKTITLALSLQLQHFKFPHRTGAVRD